MKYVQINLRFNLLDIWLIVMRTRIKFSDSIRIQSPMTACTFLYSHKHIRGIEKLVSSFSWKSPWPLLKSICFCISCRTIQTAWKIFLKMNLRCEFDVEVFWSEIERVLVKFQKRNRDLVFEYGSYGCRQYLRSSNSKRNFTVFSCRFIIILYVYKL